MATSTSLLLIVIAAYNAEGFLGLPDRSPYCADLVKITDFCNEVFINMWCAKTCSKGDHAVKQCGVRKAKPSVPQSDEPSRYNVRSKRSPIMQDDDQQSRPPLPGNRPPLPGNRPPLPENRPPLPADRPPLPMEDMVYRTKRIVGGKPAEKGAAPWHAALMFRHEQVCSGAVISPSWIVTAAHCFDEEKTSFNEQDWSVAVGDYKLFDTDNTEQVRNVKKIIIHPQNYRFRKMDIPGLPDEIPDDYDLALVKVETRVILTDHVQPICLPGPRQVFPDWFECKITGWGASKRNGQRQVKLHEATVKLIPRDICNLPLSYNGTIHPRSLCAGFAKGGVDACTYDSGGALSCKQSHVNYLTGLVSWGYSCGVPHKYGIYSNIHEMKNWIITTLLMFDDNNNYVIPFGDRMYELQEEANRNRKLKSSRS